jgi:hypothetical protein
MQSATFTPMRPAPLCGGSDCGSAAFLAPNGARTARNTTVQFADLGYSDSMVCCERALVVLGRLRVLPCCFA